MEKNIRKIEISDAEAVREIYAPSVTDNATSFELVPPDRVAIEQRIQELMVQYPWLVFEADGVVLGYAYASSHRARWAYQWCVEVSVYIHQRTRRCGVGRALYRALFDLLRRQGYVNAYAGITLPNPSSVGLHESLGFAPVGIYRGIGFKFGQWHDVAWLHLRLREEPMDPGDPVPAPALFQEKGIAEAIQRHAAGVRLE